MRAVPTRSRSPAVTPVRVAGLAPPPLAGVSPRSLAPRATSPPGPTPKQRKQREAFTAESRKPGDHVFVDPEVGVPRVPGSRDDISEGDPGLLHVEKELRRITNLLHEKSLEITFSKDSPPKSELSSCKEDYRKELQRIKAEFHGREREATEAALCKAKKDYELRELNILAAEERERQKLLSKKHDARQAQFRGDTPRQKVKTNKVRFSACCIYSSP